MKSKVLKRAIAIMLCMVIVLNGAEYMRAGGSEGTDENAAETTQEEEIVLAEDQGEDVPDPEAPVAEEGEEAGKDEAVNAAAGSGEEGKTPEQPEAGDKEGQPAEEPAAEKTEAEPKLEPELEPVTELTWENEQVCITVSAETEDIIPRGARLSVTPIEKKETDDSMAAEEKAQVEEINAQYDATAEKLQEKAEGEDYDILGFLAYDIKFVDEEGHKTEPDGSVSVTMDYKEAAIPEEVKKAQENGTEIADVTLMHLEEHANGEVKDVIDMVADESQQAEVQLTANTEVEKAEFATESFSVFTLTWKGFLDDYRLSIHIVDTAGNEIGNGVGDVTVSSGDSVSVKNVAAQLVVNGTFQKARLNNATSGTEIKRLRTVLRGLERIWQYSENNIGNSWEPIGNSTVYFVYQPTELRDLENKVVLATQHAKMIDAVSQGDLPITWSRSTTYVYNRGGSEVSLGLDWTWDDVKNHLNDLSITNENQVWDGSRLGTHYLGNYLPNNTITASDDKLYDSATWKINSSRSTDEALTRFRGSFDLEKLKKEKDYDYADYDYTIESVLEDSRIYINDNMFVFVYPEGADITNDNYKDYLAFWTGTSNRLGNIQYYQGKAGTLAYNNTVLSGQWGEAGGDDSNKLFCKITNGWYAKPVEDGAGGIIQRELAKNPNNTKFCIDVITHDNATGGGMYRLEINAQKKQKTPVSFYKVDADNKSQGIQGAKFTMTSEKGATYFFTSGVDGKTNENKLVPGTYTLKENVAGSGYLGSSNEWTVTVTKDGFSIVLNGTDDGNATAGTFTSGSNNGKWYITNKKDGTTPTPPTPEQDLGAPEHKKTIQKNGKEDYRLSLDVKGEVGQATPIDVLLIVNRSSSMKNKPSKCNRKTRMEIVNDAISKLVSKLKDPNVKTTINISIVGFSGTSADYVDSDEPYNDAETTLPWINIKEVGTTNVTVDENGGTNWQAGIREGEGLLADRNGAKTYVIFLTDGKPTFRYDETGYTIGNGQSDDENNNYNAAVSEWNKAGSKMSGAVKYVIDAGGGNKCDSLAKDVGAVGSKALQGNNETELDTAFEKIAKDITRPEYTKVSITDTLSDYADFADAEHLNLKVYKQKDGEAKSELETSQYKVVWGADKKTVTVELLNQKALEEKVTYTVEFNIKPTMKAYADYAMQNGYGGTVGEQNTDTEMAPEKQTSSGKPGFHSNATAKVTYTVNGKEDHADYAHPVLQVEQEITEHSVKKEWVGGEEESVQVQLTAKYDNGNTTLTDVPTTYQSLTTEMRKAQTLNATNGWTYKWENLPKHYYYTDKDGKLAQTEIVYSVEEVNPSNKYNVTYKKSEDGTLTTITNTAKAKWEIVKVSSNSNDVKPEGAEFTLTRTTKDESGKNIIYKGVSAKGTGVVSWKDADNNNVSMIPEGTYTLEETKAPGNYALSEETWTITVGKDGRQTVTDASGKTVDCVTTKETDANGNKTGVVIYSYYFKNTPMYELPSTGGIGTYWYTIGGMLMMAAALVLYRKKKYTK